MWDLILTNGIELLFFLFRFCVIILFIVIVVGLLLRLKSGDKTNYNFKIVNLSEKYNERKEALELELLPEDQQKQQLKYKKEQDKIKLKQEKAKLKAEKIERKQAKKNKTFCEKEQKPEENTPRVFVLEFKGDMHASQVEDLRKQIDMIISIAIAGDEVILKLQSPGGEVSGYGLAGSQLERIKEAGIKLTIAVDKVAASGGYMMACVGDKIVSAPFAVVGSIGVVAQIPNIHRLLKKHDIDFELVTAGEYKRTLTTFGENTDKGREKFKQDLEQIHVLFKRFIAKNRPNLDVGKVSTGEYWFGSDALELGLIDEIKTSDSLILELCKDKKVIQISSETKQSLIEKLVKKVYMSAENLLFKYANKTNQL